MQPIEPVTASQWKKPLIILIALLIFTRLPSLFIPVLDVDEAIYGLFARIWFDGGLPYFNCVETKPLGIYFFFGTIFSIFGRFNMIAVHAITIVIVALTAYVLFLSARMLYSSRQAGFWAALLYIVFTTTYIPKVIATSIEPVMLLPVALQFYLWMRFEREGKGWQALLSGLMFSIACIFKYQAGMNLIIFVIYLGIIKPFIIRGVPYRSHWKGFLRFIEGGILPPLIMLGYLLYIGAFQGFMYWNIYGNIGYITEGSTSIQLFNRILTRVLPYIASTALIWVLTAICLMRLGRAVIAGHSVIASFAAQSSEHPECHPRSECHPREGGDPAQLECHPCEGRDPAQLECHPREGGDPENPPSPPFDPSTSLRTGKGGKRGDFTIDLSQQLLIALWFFLSIIPVSTGHRFYGHYFLLLLPPMAILASQVAGMAWASPLKRKIMIVAIAVPMIGFTAARFFISDIHHAMKEDNLSDYKPLAEYVAAHTTPDDKIVAWGYAPMVYWYSERLPGIRFFWSDILTGRVPGLKGEEAKVRDNASAVKAWAMFFDDLRHNRPVYIIDTTPANLHDYQNYPVTRYPRLTDYIEKNYHEETRINNSIFFRRNN